MSTSTVTSKGQITLPAVLRRELNINSSDKVVFAKEGGRVYVEKADSAGALFGSLANARIKPLSSKKMKELVKKEMFR